VSAPPSWALGRPLAPLSLLVCILALSFAFFKAFPFFSEVPLAVLLLALLFFFFSSPQTPPLVAVTPFPLFILQTFQVPPGPQNFDFFPGLFSEGPPLPLIARVLDPSHIYSTL